jgi:hypothetical protein
MVPPTQEDCAICFQPLFTQVSGTVPCRHIFHTRCLERWVNVDENSAAGDRGTCPACNARIQMQLILPPFTNAESRLVMLESLSRLKREMFEMIYNDMVAKSFIEKAAHRLQMAFTCFVVAVLVFTVFVFILLSQHGNTILDFLQCFTVIFGLMVALCVKTYEAIKELKV